MRQRSETWAKLAARGDFSMDVVAVIGGVTYTAISAPVIEPALLSDAMSVGNCISSSLKMAVLTDDEIGAAAQVIIKARLIKDEETSEWQEFGTFYIDKRESNNGLITLQCFDTMLKASQRYVDPSNPDDRIGWPKSMQTCVNEIALRIGVEIDPRTVIHTEEAYQVAYPTNYTMQQVLGFIGAVHGGNWIITPENKLRLVPLISPPPETFDIVDYYYNKIYTDDGYKLVWKHYETDETVVNGAGGDIINVPVVIGKITTGKSMTISRVTITRDEDLGYSLGDDTGIELRIEGNPYANQAICDDLYAALSGVVYAPFTIINACYDPCTELGDWMLVGDQVRSVVYKQTLTFSTNFRADTTAPGKDETSSEYPYLTEIEKLHLQDEKLQKYIDTAKDEIDSQILQTRTSILLEVSGTYASQEEVRTDISILADEITAEVERSTTTDEELAGRLTINENAITAEVTRAKGEEETLSSSITVALEKIDLKVSVGDVSSQISVETGKVSIGANRLTIESDNFVLSGSGEVTAKGSLTSESGIYKTTVSAGEVAFSIDDSVICAIRGKKYSGNVKGTTGAVFYAEGESIVFSTKYDWDWGSVGYVMNNGLDPQGATERNIFFGGARVWKNDLHASGLTIDNFSYDGEVRIGCAVNSDGVIDTCMVYGNLYAEGDMWCGGEKYRVVTTEHYENVGLNAMESAVAVFSDIGSGTIDETGVAYIYFEPVFSETVDLIHSYQVFLSACNDSTVACVEKTKDYFKVQGNPGSTFDWIVFARQKDYASHRLESANVYQDKRIEVDESVFFDDEKGAIASERYMTEFPDTYDEQAAAYLKEYEQEVTNYDD